MTHFLQGLGYNTTGLRYFFRHRTLWKFAIIPLLINFLLFVVLTYLFFHFFDSFYLLLIKPFGHLKIQNPQGLFWHVLGALLWLVSIFIKAVAFLVAFMLVIVSVYLLSLIVNGPFYEQISQKVLMLEGRRKVEVFQLRGFVADIFLSFKTELIKAVLFLAVTAVLLLLSWIPIAGVVFTVMQFTFSAWFFGFGICAYPLILERITTRKIFSWGRHNALRLIGFGLPTMIPFVGILIMNFQVVGGTLLYIEHSEVSHAH